jgi:hypothetical protein
MNFYHAAEEQIGAATVTCNCIFSLILIFSVCTMLCSEQAKHFNNMIKDEAPTYQNLVPVTVLVKAFVAVAISGCYHMYWPIVTIVFPFGFGQLYSSNT